MPFFKINSLNIVKYSQSYLQEPSSFVVNLIEFIQSKKHFTNFYQIFMKAKALHHKPLIIIHA